MLHAQCREPQCQADGKARDCRNRKYDQERDAGFHGNRCNVGADPEECGLSQ